MCVFSCRRHTGERPFGCLKCGKRYFRKENLLMHESRECARVMVSVQQKSDTCQLHQRHQVSVILLLLIQTYSCQTCSATFTAKEELRVHVVSHTGEMPHKVKKDTETTNCIRLKNKNTLITWCLPPLVFNVFRAVYVQEKPDHAHDEGPRFSQTTCRKYQPGVIV